jgi:hypothetical protein
MEVILNNVRGIDDAMCSIYISKGHLTPELESEIRAFNLLNDADLCNEKMMDIYKKTMKIGAKHTTVIRFIDFSFTVRGLHRAAQDDFDAHSHRLNNRIIRSSTRICDFKGDAKSEYYKDKILTISEALKLINIELPDTVTDENGNVYKKATNGYISETALENEPNEWDIRRGLYHLAIPSTFIAKCDLFEYAHVYKMRNKDTFAHPELRDMIESLTDQISYKIRMSPEEFREYLMSIPN